MDELFKKIIGHCKTYGFIFPSSEIYDGLSATYDYGPNGVELKNNIKKSWWRSMVYENENIVGIDSAIFMHPKIWKASGHVDAFNDPMIDNKTSKKRYRADVLIEDYVDKIEAKIEKDVQKAGKRFGSDFDESMFRSTNKRILDRQSRIDEVQSRMNQALNAEDLGALRDLIIELDIPCPESGSRDWTDVRQFNLMFSTQLSSTSGDDGKLYLRPETAQGIFVNFLNVQKSSRQKVPFGIAQIGKAFRNEIVARQFIFRMREFEQMEMQYFVAPGTELDWYEEWKSKRMEWHKMLGGTESDLRYHDHESLAHYANAAVDIEYKFPFGFKELEGIHSRTDFDLLRHQDFSGKKLQYFDPELEKNYVPYVVETSIGVDRMFLACLCRALTTEMVSDGKGGEAERTVLKLPASLAPVKCAVLPLLKNNSDLVSLSRNIMGDLQPEYHVQYEEKDAIGRRYRRQDAIGTPFCITVDHDSLEDKSVTVRDRDSLEQVRISVDKLTEYIGEKI